MKCVQSQSWLALSIVAVAVGFSDTVEDNRHANAWAFVQFQWISLHILHMCTYPFIMAEWLSGWVCRWSKSTVDSTTCTESFVGCYWFLSIRSWLMYNLCLCTDWIVRHTSLHMLWQLLFRSLFHMHTPLQRFRMHLTERILMLFIEYFSAVCQTLYRIHRFRLYVYRMGFSYLPTSLVVFDAHLWMQRTHNLPSALHSHEKLCGASNFEEWIKFCHRTISVLSNRIRLNRAESRIHFNRL